jgi:hypothetical protein
MSTARRMPGSSGKSTVGANRSKSSSDIAGFDRLRFRFILAEIAVKNAYRCNNNDEAVMGDAKDQEIKAWDNWRVEARREG